MSRGVYHINVVQAVSIGLLQGIIMLFPVSSLGHMVLAPSWIGGNAGHFCRSPSTPCPSVWRPWSRFGVFHGPFRLEGRDISAGSVLRSGC